MPIRANQEGNESSKSGWICEQLDVVETAELRQEMPCIKTRAITQVQQTVVTWEYESSVIEVLILREGTT